MATWGGSERSTLYLEMLRLKVSTSGRAARDVSARGLKENVAALPSASGVKRVRIPQIQHELVPAPGKMASIAIYAYIAGKHGGKLTKASAAEAIALYAEAADDAKLHPGSHPNIDLLFPVTKGDLAYDIVVETE